jgi:signal transduction histidine kinase
MTEITARVDAEDALRCHRDQLAELVEAQTRDISNSQARLVAAINAISDGFCLLDEDEKIVLVNEHMKEMHSEINDILTPGRSLAELSARMIAERQKDAYSDRDWANHFEQVRRGDAEDEMKLPNGKWVKITRARVPDGGLIILHTDVTRYKQQETRLVEQAMELEQALDKEKELNDLQRQFVSMASHEFRTPLAIIDSSAQLLTRDLTKHDADKPLRRVEKIRAAVLRMTNLIESTLTAARIDAGKIEINPQPFDMARLVREICDRQQEVAANHEFTIMLDGLPATIRADRGAIDQIITNLLTNAVKYAPDNPEVTITGWREGDDILLSVQDHGLGISAADQQHLFTRFFRAETSTGIAGTGIGLNLVRQLVTMHGGSITVDSAVGQGSTFTVRLPVSGPAEMVAATDVSLPLKAAQ